MVFSIRKKLFSKEKNIFYDLLIRQSGKTLEGLEALAGYMDNCSPENGKQVKKCEVEADDLRLMLIQALDKAFVTPLDREDIFDLSRAIDDVMDYANSTVYEMEIYEVCADGHVKEMVNILISAGREIDHAIVVTCEWLNEVRGTLINGARTRGMLYLIPASGPKIEHEIVVLLGDPHDSEPGGGFLEAVRAFEPRVQPVDRCKTRWSWGKRWQGREALVVLDDDGRVRRLLPLEARTIAGP